MIKLYRQECRGSRFVANFDSVEDLHNFIGKEIKRNGQPFYRTWNKDGSVYFDCGRDVYFTAPENN